MMAKDNKQAMKYFVACYSGFTPAQVAHAYGYDQLWKKGWQGEGMTVDLYEAEAVNQSDLKHYFECVGYKGSVEY